MLRQQRFDAFGALRRWNKDIQQQKRSKRFSCRDGHLFKNRYESIVCEADPFLLDLARHIHLSPLRARIVKMSESLRGYPWCGDSVLVMGVKRDRQDRDAVVAYSSFSAGRRRPCRYIWIGFSWPSHLLVEFSVRENIKS